MNKPKDKRGKQFLIVETGELVTLNRIKENGEYFVDYPNGNYASFDLSDLREAKQNKVSSISNKPKKLTEAKKSDKDALNEFFDKQAETMPFNCDECNKPLYAYTRFSKRCTTCHIFPKSDFKSIQTNPLNIFYLGADLLGICAHHDAWDRLGISKRKTMNVYSLALERFELLKPHMTTAEVLEGYKYLGIELTQQILNELK